MTVRGLTAGVAIVVRPAPILTPVLVWCTPGSRADDDGFRQGSENNEPKSGSPRNGQHVDGAWEESPVVPDTKLGRDFGLKGEDMENSRVMAVAFDIHRLG